MNRRSALVVTLALGILLAPLAADAQQPGKVPRIGYLGAATASGGAALIEAFRQGLRDFGYVEGKSILIEFRWAEGKYDRLPGLAAELVRLKVDVIVVGGTAPARAAKNVTRTIPIVMASGGDPVGTGLVASLARPGGNITGLADVTVDLSAKRLELLREVVPTAYRVAVLWNPTHPTNPLQLRETQAAAQALGVQLQILEARDPSEFHSAFSAMSREHASALFVLADAMFLSYRTQIADLAAKGRLPAMYGWRDFVDAGGLMAYGVNFSDLFRRAAFYVDKILRGAKPADLPVEQPTRFELVINLKTAKALGLTIPRSVLIRADEVIQ